VLRYVPFFYPVNVDCNSSSKDICSTVSASRFPILDIRRGSLRSMGTGESIKGRSCRESDINGSGATMGSRQALENSSKTVAETVPAGRYITAKQIKQVSSGMALCWDCFSPSNRDVAAKIY
jgi:hypothetical protein